MGGARARGRVDAGARARARRARRGVRAVGLGLGGELLPPQAARASDHPLLATLPPLYPEWLGDRSFSEVHGVRFPYVAGEMANGIATARIVIAMAQAGMLGFFGAAGLAFARVEQRDRRRIQRALGGRRAAWGVNLIHSPNEPALEERRRGPAHRAAASPRVSRVGVHGAHARRRALRGCAASRRDARRARSCGARHVFAKVSRPEVARAVPVARRRTRLLDALVASGQLTADEAELARARARSPRTSPSRPTRGGHTDNRPLGALLPDDPGAARRARARGTATRGRSGSAPPAASARRRRVAAAFALGAAYVLTGRSTRPRVEAGLSRRRASRCSPRPSSPT